MKEKRKKTHTQKKRKQKQTNKQKTKTEKKKRGQRVSAKWFCCAFKLGFLQLICKYSLICKTNFELALSIILKQRELYDPKHVAAECRCLKYETCYPFWYVPQFWF